MVFRKGMSVMRFRRTLELHILLSKWLKKDVRNARLRTAPETVYYRHERAPFLLTHLAPHKG